MGRWADADRLDLGFVDRARPEIEVVVDLSGDRELHRAGQFEAVATHQFGGGGHAADAVVLLEAEDPHAAPSHDQGGGLAVVAGADHGGVVVRRECRGRWGRQGA